MFFDLIFVWGKIEKNVNFFFWLNEFFCRILRVFSSFSNTNSTFYFPALGKVLHIPLVGWKTLPRSDLSYISLWLAYRTLTALTHPNSYGRLHLPLLICLFSLLSPLIFLCSLLSLCLCSLFLCVVFLRSLLSSLSLGLTFSLCTIGRHSHSGPYCFPLCRGSDCLGVSEEVVDCLGSSVFTLLSSVFCLLSSLFSLLSLLSVLPTLAFHNIGQHSIVCPLLFSSMEERW